MTDTPKDISDHTEETFRRHDHGTQVSETVWTFTGMRSLSTSYDDGLHMISHITHDDDSHRLTTVGLHRSASVKVRARDTLATTLEVKADDGSSAFVSIFGVTLEELASALNDALAKKHEEQTTA